MMLVRSGMDYGLIVLRGALAVYCFDENLFLHTRALNTTAAARYKITVHVGGCLDD